VKNWDWGNDYFYFYFMTLREILHNSS